MKTEQIDPCPTCATGTVCRTPSCGRLLAAVVDEPSEVVPLDDALNEAAWAFVSESYHYGGLSGHMFNNLKACLKPAIEKWLARQPITKPAPAFVAQPTAVSPIDKELEQFLEGVVGVVEANSFECLTLWNEYHALRKTPWVEGLSGPLVTVGYLGSKPVCVSLYAHVIDGHRVLFMEATSMVVDHQMIEDWLLKNLPLTARQANGKYINKVDAMNFRNVFPRSVGEV